MSSQYNVSIRHNIQTPYYRAERYNEVLLYLNSIPARLFRENIRQHTPKFRCYRLHTESFGISWTAPYSSAVNGSVALQRNPVLEPQKVSARISRQHEYTVPICKPFRQPLQPKYWNQQPATLQVSSCSRGAGNSSNYIHITLMSLPIRFVSCIICSCDAF